MVIEFAARRVVAGVIALAAAIVFAQPALAQRAQDIKLCNAKDDTPDDQIIRGCTAAIQSGKLTKQGLLAALVSRGMAYGGKEQYDRAIQDFNQALKLDPTYGDALIFRGLTYAGQDRCDDAIRDFTQAIKSDPKQHEAAYGARAYCYIATGQRDLAIADYDELIRIDPKDAGNYAARGEAYAAKGDTDRAIADYNDAIRLNPKRPQTYWGRATVYVAKGDNGRAISDYNEVIGLEPDNEEAYLSRGVVHAAMNDNERAIADYNKAIQIEPKYDSAYMHRGVVYLYGGSVARAQADFKEGVGLDPENGYYAVWLDLAERRNGLPSRLAQAVTKIDMKAWPAPVVSLFLGELTPSDVLAAADDPDPVKKKGQICEANFYAAEFVLLQGQKDEALALYKAAAAACPLDYIEGIAAKAGLRALGGTL